MIEVGQNYHVKENLCGILKVLGFDEVSIQRVKYFRGRTVHVYGVWKEGNQEYARGDSG